MTAKEELRQIYTIQCKINRLKHRKQAIQDEMYDLKSPVLTPDKVQTSLTGDKLSNLIANLADLESTIIDSIAELTETQNRIISKIESLPDEHCKTVLYSRYVEMKKWELIAVEMNFTIRRVYQLHGIALIEYDRL